MLWKRDTGTDERFIDQHLDPATNLTGCLHTRPVSRSGQADTTSHKGNAEVKIAHNVPLQQPTLDRRGATRP